MNKRSEERVGIVTPTLEKQKCKKIKLCITNVNPTNDVCESALVTDMGGTPSSQLDEPISCSPIGEGEYETIESDNDEKYEEKFEEYKGEEFKDSPIPILSQSALDKLLLLPNIFGGSDICSQILAYMFAREEKYMPDVNYFNLDGQEIKSNMREKVTSWMHEISFDFCENRSTYTFAVNYLDRFLTKHSISKGSLQLLSIACMHVAMYLFQKVVFYAYLQ